MFSIIILFRFYITYKKWTSPVLQRVKNLRHAKGFSFFLANCLHCQWRGAPSGGRNSVQREKEKCVSVFTWVRVCFCAWVCVCLSFKYFNFVSNSLRAAAATTTLMIVSQPCWHFNFTLCFISTFSYIHTHICMLACVCIYFMLFSALLSSSLLCCFCLLCCSAFNCDCCSGVHCLTFVYLFAHLIASHMLLPLLYSTLSPLSPLLPLPFLLPPLHQFQFQFKFCFQFFSLQLQFRFDFVFFF